MSTPLAVEADVAVDLGSLALRVTFAVAAGETVAVVGPNGAGKSTLLRALAGLQPLRSGSVVVDGEVVDDVAAHRHVPVERRRVGVVFQDALLFPHLSVVDNVAFGVRARGTGRRAARTRALDELRRVGLGDVGGARPRELSGGQAQRVALARALATDPAVLLLDEPFAALDVTTRATVRRDVVDRLRGERTARIVVTHDGVEAAAVADRIVVLEGGRVVQEGTSAALAARPRTAYVADLAGVNLLRGVADGDLVQLAAGGTMTVADRLTGDVLVVVSPRSIALHAHRPDGTPRNVWAATVAGVEPVEDRRRVRLDGPVPVVAEVTADAAAELALAPGASVWASVKATEVTAYPA